MNKSMKKFKIGVLLLLNANILTSCYSQTNLKYIPAYIDIGETSRMQDSLKKEDVRAFILFLTTISKEQIDGIKAENSDSVEVTYFFWEQEKKTHVILLADSCIYKEVLIPGNSIFTYNNLNNLWLKKDEDIYRFVCPVNMPNRKDIIIYIDSKSKKFYEIGENLSYKLKPTRNKYRLEFITLLKQTLTQTNKNWIKIKNYNRWSDFPEEQ